MSHASSSTSNEATATRDYTALRPGELALRRGDRLAVLQRKGLGVGLSRGRKVGTSEEGLFPFTCVEVVDNVGAEDDSSKAQCKQSLARIARHIFWQPLHTPWEH